MNRGFKGVIRAVEAALADGSVGLLPINTVVYTGKGNLRLFWSILKFMELPGNQF